MSATTTPPHRTAPSFLAASLRVFELSLGQMLWSRRTIFMALVVGGPILIALILRLLAVMGSSGGLVVGGHRITGTAVFGTMIWMFYLRFTVPVLAVFYGTSLIADEVEDKTITYLFTRPIPRGAVLVGKYFAYLACTAMVVLPSVMAVFFLAVPMSGGGMASAFPSLLADLGLLALGLAVYGALFALVGAWFDRPVLMGLVFLFGWEPAVMSFPGYLKKLTVAHYLQSLVPHAMPQEGALSLLQAVFRESASLMTSLTALGIIVVGCLWLGARVVDRREYVLEQ